MALTPSSTPPNSSYIRVRGQRRPADCVLPLKSLVFGLLLAAMRFPGSNAQNWFDSYCPSGVGPIIAQTVYLSNLQPTTLIGGMGGGCDIDRGLNPGANYPAGSSSFIKSITVWPGGTGLRAIQTTFFNGTVSNRGCSGNLGCKGSGGEIGSPSTLTFALGETVTSLSIWGNGEGTRAGAIRMTTSAGQTFFVKMTDWGLKTEYPQYVGSGILAGVFGKYGSDIDAIGFLFVKALARPYFVRNVVMQPTPQQQAQVAGLYDDPQYVVSQVCAAAPVPSGQPPLSITCEISMSKTWESEQMYQVDRTLGMETSVEVSAGVSFEGFGEIGAKVSQMVSSSVTNTSAVTTVSAVDVGFSGTITATSGQAQVASSTVRVIQMSNVPWVGQLTFPATDGSSISVSISGTYSSALIANACTEVALLGTPGNQCTCAESCGEAVTHLLPQPVITTAGQLTRGSTIPTSLRLQQKI